MLIYNRIQTLNIRSPLRNKKIASLVTIDNKIGLLEKETSTYSKFQEIFDTTDFRTEIEIF